jgi:hypothetical protein
MDDPRAPRRSQRRISLRQIAMALGGGLLLAALMMVVNAAGRPIVEVGFSVPIGNHEGLAGIRQTHAGWPWTYVTVMGNKPWPLAYLDTAVMSWSAVALAFDALLGVAIVLLGGLLFSHWLGKPRRLAQYGLLDVVIAMTLVGGSLTYVYLPLMRYRQEQAVVVKIGGGGASAKPAAANPFVLTAVDNTRVRSVVWQPETAWLTRLFGEKRFPSAGHVVGIVACGEAVPLLVRLPRLQCVSLFGKFKPEHIDQLATLRELHSLDISSAFVALEDPFATAAPTAPLDRPINLPRLKRLRSSGDLVAVLHLAPLVALEELRLSGTPLDIDSVRELAKLRSLTTLELANTNLSDDMLAELTQLENLTTLDLSGTAITDAGLVHLRRLPHLETLWLVRTQVSDEGLTDLANCPRLLSLAVTDTKVTRAGIHQLVHSRPACSVVP